MRLEDRPLSLVEKHDYNQETQNLYTKWPSQGKRATIEESIYNLRWNLSGRNLVNVMPINIELTSQ